MMLTLWVCCVAGRSTLKVLCRWLVRGDILLSNMAWDSELPSDPFFPSPSLLCCPEVLEPPGITCLVLTFPLWLRNCGQPEIGRFFVFFFFLRSHLAITSAFLSPSWILDCLSTQDLLSLCARNAGYFESYRSNRGHGNYEWWRPHPDDSANFSWCTAFALWV